MKQTEEFMPQSNSLVQLVAKLPSRLHLISFLLNFKNLLPEIAIALVTIAIDIKNLELTSLGLLFLIRAILLRAIWNITILIHGLGHVAIAALIDRQPNFFSIANILEHRPISEILKSFVPGSPILIPFFDNQNYPWVSVGNTDPWGIRIKALGGISFNLISVAIAFDFLEKTPLLITMFIGANLFIVLSSRSDIVTFVNGTGDYFNCGNFGFVGNGNTSEGNKLSILETHWHEWVSARSANIWQVENRQWVCTKQNVNHRIIHNGNFDSWKLFGESVDTVKLGLWLERVLHTPNETHGDSSKIAAMMDLLITKGMWDASIRLAYQLVVAESIEEAFGGKEPAKDAPNSAPAQELLNSWTVIFEQVFEFYATVLIDTEKLAFQKYLYYLHCFERDILRVIQMDSVIHRWSVQKQVAFVKTAIDAFFHNDSFKATKIFMSYADGSFGLVVTSLLEGEKLVLTSQGQPISIGLNGSQPYAIYASEPAVVNVILSGLPESWCLDLDQKGGEIALVAPNQITVYSISAKRELSDSELVSRQISMADNP